MHTSAFFRLFPPPKFMIIHHAGLDISDDAVRCLEYVSSGKGTVISKWNDLSLPEGLVDGGDIKDEKKFIDMLREFDRANDLSYVKVSIPEEKAYLFETDVPSKDVRVIEQNIEFKLEENVPLSASDAVFYFDLLPLSVTSGALRVSVSVVPRTYIEHYLAILRSAGMFPVAFEVVPKSIARATVPPGHDETQLVVHIMKNKTGLYIVSGGVVSFTSTVATAIAENIAKEIVRVYSYWMSKGDARPRIDRIVMVGHEAPQSEEIIRAAIVTDVPSPVVIADVWRNVLDLNKYIPPISHEDSLDYAVAAGLAINA